ncbi:unnamed protein product [Caenorhabditis brenneri]
MNQTEYFINVLLSNPTVSVILQAISGLSFVVAWALVLFSYVKGNTEIVSQVLVNLTLSLLVYFALVAQYILKKIGYEAIWSKYSILAFMNFISIFDFLTVIAWTLSTSHLSKSGSRSYVPWKVFFYIIGLMIASSTSVTAYLSQDVTIHAFQNFSVNYNAILNLFFVLFNESASIFYLSLAYRGRFIRIKTVREWLTAYFDVLNAASNQPDKKTIPIVFYCSWNAVWKTPFLFLTSHWINLQERYQIIIIVFNVVTIIFNIIQAKPTKERTRKIKIFKRLMGLNTVEVYAPNPQAFENPLPKSNRAKNIEERKREEQKI